MSEQIVIVGLGEIGRRLAQAAETLGISVQTVTRTANRALLAEPAGVPLLICVREYDLAAVLAAVPVARSRDVIFVQNGFVDELVAGCPESTRAVLWFTAKGTFFADVLPSPVHGPLAGLARRLVSAAGASAETITDTNVFRRYALEKSVWSCVVGAPLAVWDMDLATARHERAAEIHDIVDETCAVVQAQFGDRIPAERVLATIDDTSLKLGWMRGGTKAVAWRNGKVVEWGARTGVATPANAAIVAATQTAIARDSRAR
jgi:ketopantoate reductase